METSLTSAGSVQAWKRTALLAALAGLVFCLYGIQGNAQETGLFGHSAILWLVAHWDGDVSYGWIIPLVSIFVVWRQRKTLAAAPRSASVAGLLIVILALLLHLAGARAQQTRVSLFSLIGILWGIPFCLYGRHVARLLLFPCAYLLFAIPPNLIENITLPLRVFTSAVSTGFLNGIGIAAIRQGTLIVSPVPGGFRLGVDDPCSGLNSVLAITAIASVYAYGLNTSQWKKWTLFFLSLPLAIVGNLVRIISVAIVSVCIGTTQGLVFYHDYSGYVVFAVAILMMLGCERMLNRFSWRRLAGWTKKRTNTAS